MARVKKLSSGPSIRQFEMSTPTKHDKGKFSRLINNFLSYGKLTRPIARMKPVAGNYDNQITILEYFQAYPEA